MRVYYFIDQFDGPVSGTEKQLLTVIRELVARGHDAKLFVLRPTGYTKSVRDFPCPIENLGIESLSSPATLPRLALLRRRFRREAPSVVHGFFNDCAMLVPLIAPRPFHMLFVAVAASNSSGSNHPSAHSNVSTRSPWSRYTRC